MFSLTRLQRYSIAVCGVVLTALLRLALDPLLGDEVPLFMFIIPVTLAAWYGGLWPGLLATGLSLVIGDYLFITPRGSIIHYQNQLDLIPPVALAFTGTAFSVLCERTQQAIKAYLECLENFRLLVESVSDHAIFTLDPDGRVSCWNAGAERVKGYVGEEVIGQHFSMFYRSEDAESGKPRRDLEIAA